MTTSLRRKLAASSDTGAADERRQNRDTREPPLWQRLLWMVVLWAGGVATVAALSALLRWWL